jgi:hypothetical protein
MTGSGLMDFLITLVVICGAGGLFFVAIDRVAPDPFLNKIGKIAVGVVLLVVVLLAIKGVLFGGGVAISAGGIIGFAIGLIIILVVLFLIDKVLDFLRDYVSAWLADIVRYVVFAIALIALLVLADRSLFASRYTGAGAGIDFGGTPSIMKPERR